MDIATIKTWKLDDLWMFILYVCLSLKCVCMSTTHTYPKKNIMNSNMSDLTDSFNMKGVKTRMIHHTDHVQLHMKSFCLFRDWMKRMTPCMTLIHLSDSFWQNKLLTKETYFVIDKDRFISHVNIVKGLTHLQTQGALMTNNDLFITMSHLWLIIQW